MSKVWTNRGLQTAVSAILAVALAMSVMLPVLKQERVVPENPISEADIQKIRVLDVGSSEGTLLGEHGIPADQAAADGSAETSSGESGQQGEGAPDEAETPPETPPEEQTPPEAPETPPELPPEEQVPPEQPEDQPTQPPEETNPSEQQQQPSEGDNAQPSGEPEGSQPGQSGESGILTPDTSGSDGDVLAAPDLGLVLTWYKYGDEAKTVVCAPEKTVKRTILQAQLPRDRLRYAFSFTGVDAPLADITDVTFGVRNQKAKTVPAEGRVELELPAQRRSRDYVFNVTAEVERTDASGNPVIQEVAFTIVICYENGLDLELELNWERAEGGESSLTCGADQTVSRTVGSSQLPEGKWNYSFSLLGESARDAELLRAEYQTSTGTGGQLRTRGGSLLMEIPNGRNTEEYTITAAALVEVEDEDGDVLEQEVYYTFVLVYENQLELMLDFTWYQNGLTPHALQCAADKKVSDSIKQNQLNNGELLYDLALSGKSAPQARILSAHWESTDGRSGELREGSGRMELSMAEDRSSQRYTLTVKAEVYSGGSYHFPEYTILLDYASDLQLQMEYTVMEAGIPVSYTLACENKKLAKADEIYDSQLNEDLLSYTISVAGEHAGTQITGISLYQAGSGRTLRPGASDQVALLLGESGKPGENTFTVTAADSSGNTYTFTFQFTYKHEGTNTIVIETNLEEGDLLTNETEFSLTVDAWSEDDAGNRISTISSTGTNTRLLVQLDGEKCAYAGRAGRGESYVLFPKNDVEGDYNQHTLYIYAEDEFGNKGEKTITFTGERVQVGEVKGHATISIDMTVLGFGLVESVEYEVLANEPVSYAVYKAVMGGDGGEDFGNAVESMDWQGDYDGSLNIGFYLARLSDGSPMAERADALAANTWDAFGDSEAEILAYIDDTFGEGSGLAVLWRCLYVNGVNVSPYSDSHFIGEQDFTSESGWVYEINGRFPSVGMDEMQLEDGDELTLHFTLAGGWEVGSSGVEGNTVGYCVSSRGNGRFSINHRYKEEVDEEGKTVYRCVCCHTQEACTHADKVWQAQDEDLHAYFCPDCDEFISASQLHQWECQDNEDGTTHTKICSDCGYSLTEVHAGTVTEDSATCTEDGWQTVTCKGCGAEAQMFSPATGHSADRKWQIAGNQHWQQCSKCGQVDVATLGEHSFTADRRGNWVCSVCGSDHDWDCGGQLTVQRDSTCEYRISVCKDCGLTFEEQGVFDELHNFADSVCTECGQADPDFQPEEHVHDWNNRWTADEDYHWHACRNGDCEEVDGLAEHNFAEGACTECGQADPDFQPEEHVHDWNSRWTADEDYHWHTCRDRDCEEVDGLAEHNFAEGACTDCGQADPDFQPEEHVHDWNSRWTADEEYHWHACRNRDCEEVDGLAEHNFAEGACTECGQADPDFQPEEHVHDWSSRWEYDEDNHWHECLTENCDLTHKRDKDGYGKHIFDDDTDDTCDECDYRRIVIVHEHHWDDEWEYDDAYHWHECLAEDCDITRNRDKDGYEAHWYDDDTDESCNRCRFRREIQLPEAGDTENPDPSEESQPEIGM